ncbi:hypothetical protein D3C86_2214240 [compost metagenome]
MTQAVCRDPAERNQGLIAKMMAKGVVQALEMIQVAEQQGGRLTAALAVLEALFAMQHEGSAVADTG